jgi:hypothetical protein
MQREGYWDYMGRCLREDREKTRSSYVQHKKTDIKNIYFIRRIEELEHKVSLLGGDPRQLELDI